jgi:hypothetical protein
VPSHRRCAPHRPAHLAPAGGFAHACGFEATVTAAFAELQERGFLTRRFKREDGTFDLKTESFG